jgi:hypothetical protein
LKKPGLDKNIPKNYRPVSNLPFISKVLEKVVESRLENHLASNYLHDHVEGGIHQRGQNLWLYAESYLEDKRVTTAVPHLNMSYHFYADDTQLYLVFEPLENWIDISKRLEDCLTDISSWMCSNMLKLNEDASRKCNIV